jgi:hypothetical protein
MSQALDHHRQPQSIPFLVMLTLFSLARSFMTLVIVFVAAPMAISQQTVRPNPLQLGIQHFHLPVEMPRASMPCLDRTTRFSASLGPGIPFAPLEEHVSTTTDAASAGGLPMELKPAGCRPDLCCIITPLDVNKTRLLLCKYRLLSDWEHILQGITNGFDVGIRSPPDCTLIFRKSCIITARPRIHCRLHCGGGCVRSLFMRFSSQRAGTAHRLLLYLSYWPGTENKLRQVQDDSGFVFSAERPQVFFSKQQYKF